MNWMLYGATGYTGKLITHRATQLGQRPILAGRSAESLAALARELDCAYRAFSLDAPQTIASQLREVKLVLNCAGPFAETAAPLIEGCLRAGAHYLDITGEWQVIEHAAAEDRRAREANIVVMPAVGFDVVPSDCLAVRLAEALPGATKLELAFRVSGGPEAISPGTATTMFTQLGSGTFVRRDGRIVRLPSALNVESIPFPGGARRGVAISWGDIASAFHSTGIPNIEVYQAVTDAQLASLRRWNWLRPLARLAPVQWFGRRWIKRNILGPSDAERERGRAEFWGRASDGGGNSVEATLATPEGYTLTTMTSLEIVRRVSGGEVAAGFHTPGAAFGAQFIESFPGVEFRWASDRPL